MSSEQPSRQAFDVRFVRKGRTNEWIAHTKRTRGFEGVTAKGAVAYTTARWQGETEGEERFATVTVLLEYDPSLFKADRIVDSSVLAHMHKQALTAADQFFKAHHPGAVVDHMPDEEFYVFPISRDDLKAMMRGLRHDAVVPVAKGLAPAEGDKVTFVESTFDPFGIPIRVPNGESLSVAISKVRDDNYEWAGKQLYYIAWDPSQPMQGVTAESGRRSR